MPAGTCELPGDEPQLVELNALLAASGAAVFRGTAERGFAVVSLGGDLAAVWGAPGAQPVQHAATRLKPGAELIAYSHNVATVGATLPDWSCRRAWQHVLAVETTLAASVPGEVGVISERQLRDAAIPDALRTEFLLAATRGPVVAAWTDGRPVSFAHVPWRTKRWWDVSIDTLPDFRRKGHAARAFAGLWRELRANGGAPVWGAEESNTASLHLAARLGFAWVAEVFVFRRHAAARRAG
jgi:GNAT superfamily N-acetyltransferase